MRAGTPAPDRGLTSAGKFPLAVLAVAAGLGRPLPSRAGARPDRRRLRHLGRGQPGSAPPVPGPPGRRRRLGTEDFPRPTRGYLLAAGRPPTTVILQPDGTVDRPEQPGPGRWGCDPAGLLVLLPSTRSSTTIIRSRSPGPSGGPRVADRRTGVPRAVVGHRHGHGGAGGGGNAPPDCAGAPVATSASRTCSSAPANGSRCWDAGGPGAGRSGPRSAAGHLPARTAAGRAGRRTGLPGHGIRRLAADLPAAAGAIGCVSFCWVVQGESSGSVSCWMWSPWPGICCRRAACSRCWPSIVTGCSRRSCSLICSPRGGAGRRSPGEVVASVIVLQALYGQSDREAVDALTFDLRWKAACGYRDRRRVFDPSALTYWRRRLAASGTAAADLRGGPGGDRPRRVRWRQGAPGAGLHDADDAVARQDTVTQLIARSAGSGREVPGAADLIAAALDRAGLRRSPGSRGSPGTTRLPATSW